MGLGWRIIFLHRVFRLQKRAVEVSDTTRSGNWPHRRRGRVAEVSPKRSRNFSPPTVLSANVVGVSPPELVDGVVRTLQIGRGAPLPSSGSA